MVVVLGASVTPGVLPGVTVAGPAGFAVGLVGGVAGMSIVSKKIIRYNSFGAALYCKLRMQIKVRIRNKILSFPQSRTPLFARRSRPLKEQLQL